jgi:hypothetical protein
MAARLDWHRSFYLLFSCQSRAGMRAVLIQDESGGRCEGIFRKKALAFV